jgi:hypothetical protein
MKKYEFTFEMPAIGADRVVLLAMAMPEMR